MKYILAVLLAGLASGVSAQALPDCVVDYSFSSPKCTYTSANGDKYVGGFFAGGFNGQGTYTFAHGDKYVGEFKDNKLNGQGTYTYANGSTEKGIWKDNEFLGTVAELEAAEKARAAAAEKAERIYNACLLDKGADVDMTVSSLERAVQETCRSIAEDPSFLDRLRYD
tara:strand:- start:491 stop:994 length:504 start_codon:yes stop_codon:yes gene_type:complete